MKRILVVDDDADFRATLQEILQRSGFTPTLAASAREGLEQLFAQRFDIVLLDLVLPDMDGLEVLREVRKAGHRAKVILITGFATIESAVDAIKLGASDYLAKPFAINDLITLVNRTFEELKFERKVQALNLDHVLGCLSNPVRRAIVEQLGTHQSMRLTELMRELSITDHAKLSFHLKNIMEYGLINKAEDRSYSLSAQGKEVLAGLRQLASRLRSA